MMLGCACFPEASLLPIPRPAHPPLLQVTRLQKWTKKL